METRLFADLQEFFRQPKPQDETSSPELLDQRLKQWQSSLWKQQNVGHVKPWHVPVDPLLTEQSIRVAIPPHVDGSSLRLRLSSVGLDSPQTVVRWTSPHIQVPNRDAIPLNQLERISNELIAVRTSILQSTAAVLKEAARAPQPKSTESRPKDTGSSLELARECWSAFLGLDRSEELQVEHHFRDKIASFGGYEFVQGWGSVETPSIAANSSDQNVRIPGNMPAKKVAVHPSPTRSATIVWQAPTPANLQIEGTITHAHPECGNGVSWSLEHRRGKIRKLLAQGVSQGGSPVAFPALAPIRVQSGDLIAIVIGPRDRNHACDLTLVDFDAKDVENPNLRWSLAGDVSSDIQASNPHADTLGNAHVWHFLAEPIDIATEDTIPSGSVLDQWLSASELAEKDRLADLLQAQLLSDGQPSSEADQIIYRRLRSLAGLCSPRSPPIACRVSIQAWIPIW